MSKEDLWIVIGRSRVDLDFGGQLMNDFERTIKESEYDLDPDELEFAKQTINKVHSQFKPFPEVMDIKFQEEKMKERLSAQVKRINELGEYTVEILKDTLDQAASTYKSISRMNNIMFFTGIGLFIFAAIYGAIVQDKTYTLIFGGLGGATFVALFILGPIDKTQNALSNLVQVEVAFMNYFEQITFWENFALIPEGNPPSPTKENIEKASEMLQERSQQTIVLLQEYIETKLVKADIKK